MVISFQDSGSFGGISGGPNVLANPTSLQFGPDGRLYVSEQNGTINAFTVAVQNGEYVATAHETLLLSNGSEVIKSIQNHNDDGTLSNQSNRQVTGILVAGTDSNPILYISSSDPRISTNADANLDTNSGVVTRVTWTGSEWEAVDIIRGLPRSEENHSNNGMVLSADGTKLYLAVGGNTNNGAPSQFFAYTGEYALSGTVLEIDLIDLNNRPILTDPAGGQNGQPRQYIYDLPTPDDPSVANDGVREDANGLDVAGPWGGNDGFNMAILPADAPLSIYADGFRNHYDLVLTEAGNLYTVDNGSNTGLGGNPIFDSNGEVTNQPNSGGSGDSEPLFLIEEGGYYSHPNPARSNQDLPWIVYDDSGNPDNNINPNSVPNLSDLVPDGVNIQDGFIIDPSKFTGDPTRLAESGVRIENNSPESNSLVNIGSSSNGLVEYTTDAFNGELQGDLLVAQFNGNIGRLDLTADGTAATYETINGLSGLSLPLDVTTGPNGSIWVTEFGNDAIRVFSPSDTILPGDLDADDDGILNVNDPFIRDSANGTAVTLFPGQTLLWDFDANQDDNRPGPDGYGGGLTGVSINGTIDFEAFFQEPSNLPGQNINLDNVKFITAAGGGTTVIENVSNGDPSLTSNNGEYLFHTGLTISPTVETFTIKWSLFNPGDALTGSLQQLGGYIGTGDQSNFLKVVAIQSPSGEIEVSLEDGDVIQANSFIQADGLFDVAATDSKQIFIELTVAPSAETATPTITYETNSGSTTVSGPPISLTGTAVLDAINGNYTVEGQSTGLAVGLFSSNSGQPAANTFQAIFGDIEVTAAANSSSTVLYRVNAGGETIAAIDGGPEWSADTSANPSLFLLVPGSNNTVSFPAVAPGDSFPESTPGTIFDTERWDDPDTPEMQWAFNTPSPGLYEVRLYVGNGFTGTSEPGQRIFDVAIEGNIFSNLDDIDLSNQFGHQVGGLISNVVQVTDGTLNIDFLHGVENPLVNGIEIIQLTGEPPSNLPPTITTPASVSVAENQTAVVDIEAIDDVDTEGNGLTYSLSGGDDASLFSIDSITGALSFITPPDFENAADANSDNIYEVDVTLTDSGTLSTTKNLSITVSDVIESGPVLSIAPPSDSSVQEAGDTGVTTLLFPVTFNTPPASDVTVEYSVEINGALTSGLTQNLETSNGAITVDIPNDDLADGPETVNVTLTAITLGGDVATLGNTTATATVTEDDGIVLSSVLYRVNAGGETIAAIDGGPEWSADTSANPSLFLLVPGSNNTVSFPAVAPGDSFPESTPGTIFDTERWDDPDTPEMQWAFNTPSPGLYEVRLYVGNGFTGTSEPGQRIFDVAIEGNIFSNLDDIDLSNQFGHQVGGLISNVVQVTDGTLNIDFLHGVENPLVNGIEIIQLTGEPPSNLPPTITTPASVSVAENQTAVVDIEAIDDVDTEGNGLTYSLSGGDDASLFSIDSITGALSFITPPDFENAADANSDNIYEVDVTLTDSGTLSTTKNLSITVSDVIESGPVLSIAPPSDSSVQEAGDTGVTTLLFPVTFNTPPASDVTVEYSVEINGALTSGLTQNLETSNGAITVDIPNDDLADGPETVNVTLTAITLGGDVATLGNTTATATVTEDDGIQQVGEAVLTVTADSNNVQISNFGNNSFVLTNTGEKTIASVELDVTNALYPDSVFDPFGLAGDTAARALTIDTPGGTGVLAPNNDPNDPNNQTYLGAGGTAGFKAIQLFFDESTNNGFEPGETIGFSVDMDPNSIAGAEKGPLDAGSNPPWDVGGVSGAEIIGSTFNITFADGSTASGQLQGNNNQGGSQGLASQDSPNLNVSLTVNGLDTGSIGTYDENGPSVIVNGPAGETARIILTKGFIQPVINNFTGAFGAQLDQQLADLAASNFPANNAVEFQTVDILLTGADQDISGQFDFSGVSNYDFTGEDQLPLGFVASVIDPGNEDLSLGPVTQPIYLEFDGTPSPPTVSIISGSQTIDEDSGQVQISLATNVTVPSDETVDVSFEIVPNTATPGNNGDYDYVSTSASFNSQTGVYTDTVTIAGSSSDVTIPINILQDFLEETSEAFTVNITDVSSNATIGSSSSVTITIVDDDSASGVLYRVNAGGNAIAAIDGGSDWSADTMANPSPFLVAGSNRTAAFSAVTPNGLVPDTTPDSLFNTERWDEPGSAEMRWAFDIPIAGFYDVRLYLGNGFIGTNDPGERIFDVAIEDNIPTNLDDIDLSDQFGHQVGGVISNVVEVTDGNLNIDFLHGVENPLINGIEIIQL